VGRLMAPPKRPWFRFYVEAVHDRKLRRLKPETRWLFVACLAAARQSHLPGWLYVGTDDPMGWEDLMDFAGMTRKQIEDGADALQAAGILAYDRGLKCWFVPSWNERQYESDDSTPRAAKSRRNNGHATAMQRPNNGDTPSDATPPETEAETETETDPTTAVPPEPMALTLVAREVASPTPDAAMQVFEAWVSSTNRTGRTVCTPDRRKLILKQLKHYPVHDLIDAVQGWQHSAHHRGENDRGTVYDDLELLLRDAKHIEMFRDLHRDPPGRPVPKGIQGITAWLARSAS
jgi:hypothetical protein